MAYIRIKGKSPLKNTEAIRKMLDGEHRLQKRTVVAFTTGSAKVDRVVGAEWEDENGKKWKQIAPNAKIEIEPEWRQEIRQAVTIPFSCPKCNKEMDKHLDRKFYRLRNMCFDCNLDFEHQLQIKGLWKEYENYKVLANRIDYVKDIKSQLEDQLKNPIDNHFIQENGIIEKWRESDIVKEQCRKSLEEMNQFLVENEKILRELGQKLNIGELERQITE